jgi:hypothetical protein
MVLMHSMVFVEFLLDLQYPESSSKTLFPGQNASTKHGFQEFEFHSKEKLPAEHSMHLLPNLNSPGIQWRKLMVIKFSLTGDP